MLIERNWANLKRRYGLTEETFRELMEFQGCACAICKEYSYNLVVDHDHETGVVRGLLCSSCNKLLGFAKDNVDILHQASQYILRSHVVGST